MPHGGGKVTGQWTIPPPRPRWGGGGLSLIGALWYGGGDREYSARRWGLVSVIVKKEASKEVPNSSRIES